MLASNSNFYQVGASLPIDAPSYVQRQADEEFYQKLRSGKFCYVLNSRQMGKSSLRVQTMQRLQQQGTVCAAIDLTGIGKHKVTQSQWYGGIVYALVESCHLEDKFDFDWQTWWQKNQEILDPVMCLRLFIEQVLLEKIQQPIVIFVDEIDRVLSQDFSLDDFFALIRFFQNQRVDNSIFERLTFALLGVATPSDLITDKSQTPFNIGEGIELHGFRISEVQPLIEGLQGKVSNPQKVMESILYWTGGQPFLTQKLCKFMVEESEKDNPHSVIEVVRARIIENWESQDNPEHLRTIQDRMLLEEYVAGRFLGWYQQILLSGEIFADDSVEQMNFRLTGLVVKQQDRLKVYNKIYESVFNSNWVEQELDKLRPYSESFRAWVESDRQDESRLLRGKALQDALMWADGKSLSLQDNQYIAASQKYEFEQARRKTQRVIRFGSVFLVVSIVGAIVASVRTYNTQKERQVAVTATRLEQTGINLLREPFRGGEIEGLLQAMRVGRELKSLVRDKQSLADYPAYSPVLSLSNILSKIHERNQLQGYKAWVMSVAFSPDGKILASASADSSIKLWDVTKSKEIFTLTGHKNGVDRVAFSPDGKILASASLDKSIKLWNIATGKEISTLTGHKDTVISVAFSPNGTTLASASDDKNIKLWDIATGKEISTLAGHKNTVMGIAFSPDGKTLASASLDGTIKLWNLATSRDTSTLIDYYGGAFSVAFSPDGKTLASSSANIIKLWNPVTKRDISTLTGHRDIVSSITFSPDSKTLASASADGTIKLWNPTTSGEISTLTGHRSWVFSVAFSPDGKTLASGGRDNSIKLWNFTAGKDIFTLAGHRDIVSSVAFSPDGKTLASGGHDNSIKLWNVARGQGIFTLTGHKDAVRSVGFSLDGKILASASVDKSIKLWEVVTGKEISTLIGHENQVNDIAFSSDGKTLASASFDKSIKLWDIATGKEISTLTGHKDVVSSVAFSPDGKTLASASGNSIKLWNFATGKEVSTLIGHKDMVFRIVFSPDSKTLASASADATIKLWNPVTSQEISTLTGHRSEVNDITFSPDSKILASASNDDSIKLWNIATSREIFTLTGHYGWVNSVAFSPNSKTLASASNDETIKLWSLDLDDLLARGCSYLKDYLATRDELRKELCPGQ